jgi:hypothetical protein
MSILEILGALLLFVVVGLAVGHAFGYVQFGISLDKGDEE